MVYLWELRCFCLFAWSYLNILFLQGRWNYSWCWGGSVDWNDKYFDVFSGWLNMIYLRFIGAFDFGWDSRYVFLFFIVCFAALIWIISMGYPRVIYYGNWWAERWSLRSLYSIYFVWRFEFWRYFWQSYCYLLWFLFV